MRRARAVGALDRPSGEGGAPPPLHPPGVIDRGESDECSVALPRQLLLGYPHGSCARRFFSPRTTARKLARQRYKALEDLPSRLRQGDRRGAEPPSAAQRRTKRSMPAEHARLAHGGTCAAVGARS
jgi:hypothetical protein